MSLFKTIDILAEGAPDAARGGRRHTRNPGTCRGCGRSVLWCRTTPGLKSIPFDVNPEAIETSENGRVETVSTEHTHWASCPERDSFRRQRA